MDTVTGDDRKLQSESSHYHDMGVRDIVDFNVLVQGPCSEFEQEVIGVCARS